MTHVTRIRETQRQCVSATVPYGSDQTILQHTRWETGLVLEPKVRQKFHSKILQLRPSRGLPRGRVGDSNITPQLWTSPVS